MPLVVPGSNDKLGLSNSRTSPSVHDARPGAPLEAMEAARLNGALLLDRSQIGRGYGHPGPAAALAQRVAQIAGLRLDQTYTEKAFAVAVARAGRQHFHTQRKVELGVGFRTLYWHTLSAVPLAPLLEGAPTLDMLPSSLRLLLKLPSP